MLNYDFGKGNVDKFTKLSKTGFSTVCFTADFLRALAKGVRIWLLCGRLGARRRGQAFRGS